MAQNGLATLDGARFITDVSGTRTDDAGWRDHAIDPLAQTPKETKELVGTDARETTRPVGTDARMDPMARCQGARTDPMARCQGADGTSVLEDASTGQC